MARIRSIKPDFFDSTSIADLSMPARLFFIGLWTQADRDGRLEDDMRRLKARIFPYDDVDVEALAVELHAKDMIRRYPAPTQVVSSTVLAPTQVVRDPGYIWIVKFLKHQRPHSKEAESLIPPCPDGAGLFRGSPLPRTVLAPTLAMASTLGREGKGMEVGMEAEAEAPDCPPPLRPQRAPLVTSHKSHAACGRVCVPAFLHAEFRTRRNHDGADMELRNWYLAVDLEWHSGAHARDEPGDAIAFWRARYAEQWPPAAAAQAPSKADASVPQWIRDANARKRASLGPNV
jgi:translation initiation factor IF-1